MLKSLHGEFWGLVEVCAGHYGREQFLVSGVGGDGRWGAELMVGGPNVEHGVRRKYGIGLRCEERAANT